MSGASAQRSSSGAGAQLISSGAGVGGVSGAAVADLSTGGPGESVLHAQLVTPGDWQELDLDPRTRRRSIRRAVARAATGNPGLAAYGVRLIAVLDDLSERAVAAGAFYCASMVVDDSRGGLVVATVLLQAAGGASPVPPSRELCAELATVVRNDPDWAGADVRVVRLPFVGPAVRICVVSVGCCVQFLVPTRSGQVLVTFSCPCPAFVPTMTELFDAMAASLTLSETAQNGVVADGFGQVAVVAAIPDTRKG